MPVSCFTVLREREQALPRNLSTSAATFRGDVSGSQGLIYRMELQRKLKGHRGCVNTVSFNPTGDLLVSGSDDQNVILWDWRQGVRRLRFEPGHTNNIFQARFLPGTYDKSLISCAADGQVRVSYLQEGSSRPTTKRLHRHMGRAHKFALQHASPYDPAYGSAGGGGPPCFYSSGEDGDVCFFDLRVSDSQALGRMAATVMGWQDGGGGSSSAGPSPRRRTRQIIDLNAIHVNPARPWQLVVGGADEVIVVYDIRNLTSLTSSYHDGSGGGGPAAANSASRCVRVNAKPLIELCPSHLRPIGDPSSCADQPTHVTCVMFGQNGDVLATYNDDDVYLLRPPGTQGSGGGRGRPGSNGDSDEESGARHHQPLIRVPRSGGGGGTKDAVDGENDDEDDSFFRPFRRRRHEGLSVGCGAAKADAKKADATSMLTSSSRSSGSAEQCEDYVIGHFRGHRNNQTVKGVSFLGEREEWVVSGSDCGHIYIWSRDTCRLHSWLRGDNHVVNCLEPHPSLPLHMATSGIDSDIKLWAPTAEEPRAPGPAAQYLMDQNARDRGGGGWAMFAIGGSTMVLPRSMLETLLRRNVTSDDEDNDGDGRGVTRGRQLPGLLAAALRLGTGNNGHDDDEDEEGSEEDEEGSEEDEEGSEEDEEGSEEDEDGVDSEHDDNASGSGDNEQDESNSGGCEGKQRRRGNSTGDTEMEGGTSSGGGDSSGEGGHATS
ncbi:hypothetical protein Vafri_8049 [Volvox africanus]|uniref:Uncharacterized protein n=1 Tax=Volvox africanus TaxID=51714 RepID=A0A8J4B271_9CHLO|nr:hypothetical protein Vafri_8049 [Volvox africanus]